MRRSLQPSKPREIMTDQIETYLRVLGNVNDPDGFGQLLHQHVTIDARGTDNLWGCSNYTDLIDLVPRAFEAGVRVDIVESYLVADRMLLGSRIRRPASAIPEKAGPAPGQAVWWIFTLHESRIARIEDFATRHDALIALIEGFLHPSNGVGSVS
jgi:hypothetical protein